MKQSFNTSKLYYGFPIFILGYQDQNFEHNITTCSSSYSLGDWLTKSSWMTRDILKMTALRRLTLWGTAISAFTVI